MLVIYVVITPTMMIDRSVLAAPATSTRNSHQRKLLLMWPLYLSPMTVPVLESYFMGLDSRLGWRPQRRLGGCG